MSVAIDHVLQESRYFEPNAEFMENALIKSYEEYEALYRESIDKPDQFWGYL